jgi:hypothetical protein
VTDPEDFLSRWSRRKREAKVEPEAHPGHEQAVRSGEAESKSSTPQAPVRTDEADLGAAPPAEIFDISKLPSLDSIGAATDIRVFMQPGVPEALSRAALRRAWSADPAIRDFIGLAENSWDFTASDGMHGFGALDPADAKRLLAQLFGEGDEKSDGAPDDIAPRDPQSDADAAAVDASETVSDDTADGGVGATEPDVRSGAGPLRVGDSASDSAASQQYDAAQEPEEAMPARRVHGRALPQ